MPTSERTMHRPKTPWPHGLPTTPCGVCQGTGLDRAARDAYDRSRATPTDGERPSLLCPICQGRGRVLAPTPT